MCVRARALARGCVCVSPSPGSHMPSPQVFPRINVKTMCANKLLGLFGQDFPIPVAGHQLHEVRDGHAQ